MFLPPIQGYVHQGLLAVHGVSKSYGTQCTAIALVALAFANFNVDPTTWGPQHLDTVIYEGDSLYQSIVQRTYNGDTSMLLNHEDLPSQFSVLGSSYEQTLESTLVGVVNNLPAMPEAGTYTLTNALEMAFNQSPWLIGTFGGTTVAVFFIHGRFYIFDSHARNQQGDVDPHGSSILMSFESTDTLLAYLHRVYRGNIFNLSIIQLCRRITDCNTLVDPHNERSLDAPDGSYLKHASLGVCPDVVSIENLSQSDNNVHQDVLDVFCSTPGSHDVPETDQFVAALEHGSMNICTNDYVNKDSDKGGVSVNVYRHRADHSYTSQIHSKPKGKSRSLKRKITEDCSVIAVCTENEVENCPCDLLLENEDSFHLDVGSFEIINSTGSYLDGNALPGDCHFSCDHSYHAQTNSKSKRKRGSRKKKLSNATDVPSLGIEKDLVHNNLNVGLDNNCSFHDLDVASYEVVITTNCQPYRTNGADNNAALHSSAVETNLSEYDTYIRCMPNKWCCSCDRFLFPNQVKHIGHAKTNALITSLNLDSSSDLCSTCRQYLTKNKIPSICSKLNFLHISSIPFELNRLSGLEKKLLALIQVCMTLVLLPGGQYAEKGLVVDLPRDVHTVVEGLANFDNLCLVHFEHDNAVGVSGRSLVDPFKIIEGHSWLKSNNRLYIETSTSDYDNFEHIPSDTCVTAADGISLQNTVNSLEQITLAPVDYTGPKESTTQTSRQQSNSEYARFVLPNNEATPVSVYEIPSGEEKAFPWLFPEGKFGYTYPRPTHLNPSMYFRYRLYNRHGFWRKDITYLLHAAISYDKLLLRREIGICMKMSKGSSSDSHGQSTTAGDVRARNTNPDILQNSYMFMKNIRGTVAYFRNALYDLLAMFRCLGPPTLFMTLSADDLHWPELGMLLENLTFANAASKGSFFSSMRSDPLLTAIHFDRRFTALMKFIIHGQRKPLGEVYDYFARVEFQNRGSPHYHIFFWVKGVPHEVNERTRQQILKYISDTVHTHLPSQADDAQLRNLVTKLQTHKHSKYCMKTLKPPCRFGFPKRLCERTVLIPHIVAVKNKGKFYDTYRPSDSLFINSYNPDILRHWRANMDIQLINDANGAAYYVCHYLCKSEPDELKCALANLINTVFRQNPDMTAFQRLWNVGLCVLKNRRVSAQEAAFRLSNLCLIQSSRTVVSLNTRPQDKRFKMLKPVAEINALSDNDTDIFLSNIVDYYHARPSTYDTMSLHYFASWYVKCSPPNNQVPTQSMLERLFITKYTVWFRKRKKFAIIRFPCFSVCNDDYYFTLLILLLPHRSELDLVGIYGSAKEAFTAKHSLLDFSMDMHNTFLLQVENSMRRIRLAEAELEEQSDILTSSHIDINTHSPPFCANLYTQSQTDFDTDTLHFHQTSACSLSETEFALSSQKLTNCQHKAMDAVKKHFSEQVQTALRMFITGGAGVGKSFLLKLIVAFLQLYTPVTCGVSPVKCCSPTGTAARLINGQTIHSLLKIPVDRYLNYAGLTAFQLRSLQSRFVGVHTLVIDEVSMVSDRMFTFISRRLSEITGNSSPFGGLNVILFGDFFQIKPVCGSFAFQNKVLWELFVPVFLRQNVRQSQDIQYISLLNRARVGMLNSDDIAVLKSRLHSTMSHPSGLCIFPTRSSVLAHNQQCLQRLGLDVHKITAEHYFSTDDANAGAPCGRVFIPDDDRDAGNLPSSLEVSRESRVMLLRNLDISRGLVNGATGIVRDICSDSQGHVQQIIVLFDDSMDYSIAIEMIEHKFVYAGRSIVRRSFPLSLCWACTIHKVQGLSTSSCSLDLGSSVFQPGMAYVALSRVTQLSGLQLLRFNPDVVTADQTVLEEYNRLRELAKQ